MSLLSFIRSEREAPRQFLHVATQGVALGQSGQRLTIYKQSERLFDLPIAKLRAIILYGDVRPSKGAIRLCLDQGVSMTFLTRSGRFRGRLSPRLDHGASLRLRQYQLSIDPSFCLRWAKSVVRGKLHSALAHIGAKERGHSPSPAAAAAQIRQALANIESAKNLDDLRGREGSASAAYFAAFRSWLPATFEFRTRARENTDPANILLNLGYTLLYREMESLASAAGLDPMIGFYHAPHSGRASLACDMQEEFRHDFLDRVVITLLNRRQILPDKHFLRAGKSNGASSHFDVRLAPEALSTFVAAYEEAAVEMRPSMLVQLERMAAGIENGVPYSSHLEN